MGEEEVARSFPVGVEKGCERVAGGGGRLQSVEATFNWTTSRRWN